MITPPSKLYAISNYTMIPAKKQKGLLGLCPNNPLFIKEKVLTPLMGSSTIAIQVETVFSLIAILSIFGVLLMKQA
jgi:hypothetical protein